MWVRETRSPLGSWVHRVLSVSFLKRSHEWKRWQLLWKGYKKTHHKTMTMWDVLKAERNSDSHWRVFPLLVGNFWIVVSSGISKATNVCNCRSWAEPLFTEDLSAPTRYRMHSQRESWQEKKRGEEGNIFTKSCFAPTRIHSYRGISPGDRWHHLTGCSKANRGSCGFQHGAPAWDPLGTQSFQSHGSWGLGNKFLECQIPNGSLWNWSPFKNHLSPTWRWKEGIPVSLLPF